MPLSCKTNLLKMSYKRKPIKYTLLTKIRLDIIQIYTIMIVTLYITIIIIYSYYSIVLIPQNRDERSFDQKIVNYKQHDVPIFQDQNYRLNLVAT